MSDDLTIEKVQALITRGPYHQWLGLKVTALGEDSIELKATWREEWVVNPDRRYTHGGVLAALVDLAADWAMVKRAGRGNSRPPRRKSSIVKASSWRAAAAPISRHHPKNSMPEFTNLGDLIRRDRDLKKVALIDLGGEVAPREFAFAALDKMANGVANGLLARGLKRGDRVAILSVNRAEYIAAYYGIMRAGLVAVPVNFKFPATTIDFVLRDSGAKLVFCDTPRRGDVPTDLPAITFGAEFDRFLGPSTFTPVTP